MSLVVVVDHWSGDHESPFGRGDGLRGRQLRGFEEIARMENVAANRQDSGQASVDP